MKPITEMNEDELRQTIRQLKRMRKCLGLLVAPSEQFERASGYALCPECGLELYDHPEQKGAADVMVISCDGRRWKL